LVVGVSSVDLTMSTRAHIAAEGCAHAPVMGGINSPFGPRRSVQNRNETRQHQGVDLFGRVGDPVWAVAPGIVEHATENGARGFGCYGRVVVIHHPQLGEDRTLYAHLSRVAVEVGDHVEAGQVIGAVGATNGSTEHPGTTFAEGACGPGGALNPPSRGSGPHLHFEASPGRYPRRYDDPRYEPIRWLSQLGIVYRGNRLITASTCGAQAENRTTQPLARARRAPAPAGGLAFAGTIAGMGIALIARWKKTP